MRKDSTPRQGMVFRPFGSEQRQALVQSRFMNLNHADASSLQVGDFFPDGASDLLGSEGGRSAQIKLRWVGNDVAEIGIQKDIVRHIPTCIRIAL
jgi:hypothetical protein